MSNAASEICKACQFQNFSKLSKHWQQFVPIMWVFFLYSHKHETADQSALSQCKQEELLIYRKPQSQDFFSKLKEDIVNMTLIKMCQFGQFVCLPTELLGYYVL